MIVRQVGRHISEAAALDWVADALPGEPVVLSTQTANDRSMRLAANGLRPRGLQTVEHRRALHQQAQAMARPGHLLPQDRHYLPRRHLHLVSEMTRKKRPNSVSIGFAFRRTIPSSASADETSAVGRRGAPRGDTLVEGL